MLMKNIHIEYCDASGEMLSYAEIAVDYGNEYTGNSEAYDRIAGKKAVAKINLNMVIDYATKNVRTETYALYNKTKISVYGTELGSKYKIYRDELLSYEISTLAEFGSATEKSVYLVS